MRAIAITAAAVLLAAGCANDQASPPAASTSPSTSTSVKATPKPSPPATSAPAKLTAEQVVAAFAAAKLPVSNPRDNSKNCESLGCAELTTTDDISVYTWDDPAKQQHFAKVYGAQAFSSGNVVLSYAAARTPAANRLKYQQVLKGMG
ncbi:hypothetical protein [Kribbella sp. NPDC023855]|uniref:hypothetical protein n=1 Tax=Kribbella sp. NPDC023855 TaxID=3154698 RepID=UPI0033F26DA3